MAVLNDKDFADKVYGCWIGKNIGGTLGTPFEGRQELLDVTDFHSPSGKPLANDDLDLQLIWLKALEDRGPLGVNERVLGEYWLNFIPPHWNEYGIGKSNMKGGLLPPISGDYKNDWKHSNGAWIRSEIWACVAPGCPDIATKYAWYDAVVDHGGGEGTFAELFTAAVESAAFVESDRDKLIAIGLSRIPPNCRVARSLHIALDAYAAGKTWQEARRMVLEDSADLGWFQAPGNVAFMLIGWLYGEGDFKKSLLIATSCGDDTDCTAATIGSILGILCGASGIPADWKKYIGDDIVSVAIDRGSWHAVPKTCRELTERVIRMTPQVLAAHRAPISLSGKATDLSDFDWAGLTGGEAAGLLMRKSGMTVSFDFIHTAAELAYSSVSVQPGQSVSLTLTLRNLMPDPRHIDICYHFDEAVTLLKAPQRVVLKHRNMIDPGFVAFDIELSVADFAPPAIRGIIELIAPGRPSVGLIPVLLLSD